MPTTTGRLRPVPGGSGGRCITPDVRRMCWIASVCCCTAEKCWAKPLTVLPNSPAWEMLTGFGWEMRTIPPNGGVSWAQEHRDCSLHLGNAHVPPGSPAVGGSEDRGDGRATSGRERGHPRLRQLLMHLREERHRSRRWL